MILCKDLESQMCSYRQGRGLDLAIVGKMAALSPTALVWQQTHMPSDISKKNSDCKKTKF